MSPRPQTHLGYAIESISFRTFFTLYKQADTHSLTWPCPFVLPEWLEVWWKNFRSSYPEWEPLLLHIRKNGETRAIAPLMKKETTARFLGSPDVMDYQDFITGKDVSEPLFTLLLDELKRLGVRSLELDTLRPESAVLTELAPLVEKKGREGRRRTDGCIP